MAESAGGPLKWAENALQGKEKASGQPLWSLWPKPQMLPLPMHSRAPAAGLSSRESSKEIPPFLLLSSTVYHHKREPKRLEC